MKENATSPAHLRYLDAGGIANPDTDFEQMPIESESGERLGLLDGVVIEPAAGRIRYLVIEAGRWWRRQYRLVPLTLARLDRKRGSVRMDLDGRQLQDCPRFDPDALLTFPDEARVSARRRWKTSAA
jgi:sporulation protein YlmC with PRC-barrel domain